MKCLNSMAKALPLFLLTSFSASAATYTVDFQSLFNQTTQIDATGVDLNSFVHLSAGAPYGNLSVGDTNPFNGTTLYNVDMVPGVAVFEFDLSQVNVTSVRITGLSNNAPVTSTAYSATMDILDEVVSDNSWSSVSELLGSNIASVSVLGYESFMTGFEIEYTPISAVPVPAAAWLFGTGLVGLISVARRRAS